VVLLPTTQFFFNVYLQLVVLAAFVAYVSAQSGYAAPAYSAPAYAADYKPGYANGRVKMQVNEILQIK
jgi:hypothetical protein